MNADGARRILFVDDDADAGNLIQDMLTGQGDVVVTGSGAEALVLAANVSFDVMMIDLAMPEMDGFALIDSLRALGRHAMTPIVAVSGIYSEDAALDRVFAQGVAAFLPKPFDRSELAAVLEHVDARPKR